MAKVKITKKLAENPQLAELLTEKNYKVGDEVENSELDELINLSVTTELVELTQADFDAEPGLTSKGLEVGDKVRLAKKVNETLNELNEIENPSYKVISDFRDKFNESKIFKVGDEVPVDFDDDRIQDLLNRKLIG